MPRIERLTESDKRFMRALKISAEPCNPSHVEEKLKLEARNFALRVTLAEMTHERELYRSRFLKALTVAVGMACGIVISAIVLWWLLG